jgi:uncharacterized membrane protein
MAGTTIVDYSTFKTFWKLIDNGQGRSTGLLEATSKFPRLAGIGAALLILTGIGMMALTHGVFGEQLWFRIKFALVIILILNSLLVGRRQGLKLRKIMTADDSDTTRQADSLRASLNRFYLSQLIIFFIIIFLSVFKFN